MKTCLCFSGIPYSECCEPFHKGRNPQSALELVRSRFSAYAMNMPRYIIETTHPASPSFEEDRKSWKEEISFFSKNTQFQGLEIVDFKEKKNVAIVSFIAFMKEKKQDTTFSEKSFFEKLHGKWYYRLGQLEEGKGRNLVTADQMRILPLAYYGNEILRKKGETIPKITAAVITLAEEMIETMDACDGLGLAAPQVHHSCQLFVIRHPIEDAKGNISLGEAKVFINPSISDPSKECWTLSEGCLSIPSIQAEVKRPKEITVEYTNLKGERRKERVSGWEARVIMHENDHLQGTLFIDHLSKEKREELKPLLRRMDRRIHQGNRG